MSGDSADQTADISQEERARYARHLSLPELGIEGQRHLKAASVLCVGIGGLGSPLLLYLAAAGVGRIGIVDCDVVDHSNLQRQVVHSTKGVGRKKVLSAAATCGPVLGPRGSRAGATRVSPSTHATPLRETRRTPAGGASPASILDRAARMCASPGGMRSHLCCASRADAVA